MVDSLLQMLEMLRTFQSLLEFIFMVHRDLESVIEVLDIRRQFLVIVLESF